MDTEGLDSEEGDVTHDRAIVAIAMLTCSHFVYNSKTTIGRQNLNEISMCV